VTVGAGADTVRCPRCLVPYTLHSRGGADRHTIDRVRAAFSAVLQVDCPRHMDRMAVAG
jgi:hypothetical protein